MSLDTIERVPLDMERVYRDAAEGMKRKAQAAPITHLDDAHGVVCGSSAATPVDDEPSELDVETQMQAAPQGPQLESVGFVNWDYELGAWGVTIYARNTSARQREVFAGSTLPSLWDLERPE